MAEKSPPCPHLRFGIANAMTQPGDRSLDRAKNAPKGAAYAETPPGEL